MHRIIVLTMILFAAIFQAQARFSIRAASEEAVSGWDRMEVEGRAIWVSPMVSLTAADIARAEQSTLAGAGTVISVVFSDAGAQKMRALSAAQMNKLIAIVLDGKVIFAPRVRAEMTRQAFITGKAPDGLSASEVQRILASLNRK